MHTGGANDDAVGFGPSGVTTSSMGNMVSPALLVSDAVGATNSAEIRAMEEKVVMLERTCSRTNMVCM